MQDVILADHPAAVAFEKLWNDAVTRRRVARSLFTAGPNEEEDGLYGVLTFVEPHHGDDD